MTAVLRLKITPNAPANAVLGETGGVIRLKIQARLWTAKPMRPGGVSGRSAPWTQSCREPPGRLQKSAKAG